MHKLSLFLAGALSVMVIALVAGGVFVMVARGFSARERPSMLERWVARRARGMAAPRDAKERVNPLSNSPDVLAEAKKGGQALATRRLETARRVAARLGIDA